MIRSLAFCLLALVALASPSSAELVEITLLDGAIYEGVLIRETPQEVVIRLAHGTLGVGRADIDAVKRLGPAAAPKPSEHRLPGWEVVFDRVLSHPEARSIRQIPATVIEDGILRHVPYMSHRFGSMELNIYGDPEAPACIEAGIFHGRPLTDDAKRSVVRLMAEILTNAEDRRVLESLNLDGPDERDAHGFTFEVTPPEADDSFGGWWITVYNPAALDAARATEEELRAITAARHAAADTAAGAAAERDHLAWTADDHTHARPTRAPRRPDPPAAPRPHRPEPAPQTWGGSSSADRQSGGGGGSVYVRGYFRKDGTYVRPHARRRPRR